MRKSNHCFVFNAGTIGTIFKIVAGGAVICGLAAVAGPRAAGKFSASGLAVAGAGELISPTAQLAGTTGIGIATNVISFAARSILTPRLG